MPELTLNRLKELLEYNPETGLFSWRAFRRRNKNKEGVAGTVNGKGYVQITIDYHIYLAHRLAWFYVTGDWPSRLDHEDEIKSNNRIANLRIASSAQNNGNTTLTKPRANGLRGVQKFGGKFAAYIRFERKVIYLGMHETEEQAHSAYRKKHLELHREFSIYNRKETA